MENIPTEHHKNKNFQIMFNLKTESHGNKKKF
jgi:hypothetical protein